MSQYLPFLYWLSWTVLDPVGLRFPKGSFTSSVRVNAADSALIGNNGIISQECIPVGYVLSDSVTVSPATHAPCHASPSPPYTPPLCRTCHPPHMPPAMQAPSHHTHPHFAAHATHHTCPLPCKSLPTIHTPTLPHMQPTTHAPCHASPSPPYTPPLRCTCHPPHMPPAMQALPHHACPLPNTNPTMHTPFTIHALSPCRPLCHTCPLDRRNDRRL